MLAEFDVVMPSSLDEALDLLANGGRGSAVPLAGGTNLVVDLRADRMTADVLVGLGRLPGFRRIEVADGRVAIGGGTTVSDILDDPRMPELAASLTASSGVFAGLMVRNTATVAGNICYGSPAADLVPPLLALDAEATLASTAGTRQVPLDSFFHGYKETERRHDEIVTEIAWDAPSENSVNLFYKLARRKGDAIAVVAIAVGLSVEAGRCVAARIGLGAVAPVCLRAKAAEAMLEGQVLTPQLIDETARAAAGEASPIDDIRASAEYRAHGVHVLTRRLLTQAWDRIS